jgi:hypothetical protein
VNFSDQPPSKQWAALKFGGEEFAGVWFKPEGEPSSLRFRIPEKSFRIPGLDQLLTTENLLKSVGIAMEEVESWRQGGVAHDGLNGSNPEFKQLLPPPAGDMSHLDISVWLKAPVQVTVTQENGEPEIPLEKWQDLEARWKAILGLEATMEALRQRMDSLRAEMEASFGKTLTTEEKASALNGDVAQWNKAKSRVHHAVPKAKEFIHRATWAVGTPERKKLEEIFKNYIQPHIYFPEMGKVPELLDNLQKDRQILSAQGMTVFQECTTIYAEIQGALRTLKSNAAANALKKRDAAKPKGKPF